MDFFNETSKLFFAELAIFHYIQIKSSFGKIVWKITGEKVWRLIYAFWYLPTYVTYTKILVYVRDHVQQFYGNSWTLLQLKQIFCFLHHNINCAPKHLLECIILIGANNIVLLSYLPSSYRSNFVKDFSFMRHIRRFVKFWQRRKKMGTWFWF